MVEGEISEEDFLALRDLIRSDGAAMPDRIMFIMRIPDINHRKLRLSLGSRNSRRQGTKCRFARKDRPKTEMKRLVKEAIDNANIRRISAKLCEEPRTIDGRRVELNSEGQIVAVEGIEDFKEYIEKIESGKIFKEGGA